MRIAELSRRSGVSVPTIKFYLREGLLAPGDVTGRNQASYDEAHERRLRLVRALVEVGGLSLAAVREVLAAADGDGVATVLSRVRRQAVAATAGTGGVHRGWADDAVAGLIARRGWAVDTAHPAARALAHVLTTAALLGQDDFPALLDRSAAACEELAAAEVESLAGRWTGSDAAESAVVGTVLGDAALTALRRLAQADATGRAFGAAG
ncbi:MerR family transcriptional regulator [Saccharothrix syringae]|uniref:MerR family transcriptional regulator n=1 Tax=Saccharothrix syringae TaxID=103733 RepID=A0A5Q0H478_SACSY|nr:MerR family transcriptional regulator [Saccharothrix syringae]QFZ20704.1 MerR family transcriptional regulator [Saccharothrix syringae]